MTKDDYRFSKLKQQNCYYKTTKILIPYIFSENGDLI